jgi:glycosidase
MYSSIHLNRGTPYIYMGEEIGMLDPDFDMMEQYVDVESLNAYQELLNPNHGSVFEKPPYSLLSHCIGVRELSRDLALTISKASCSDIRG